MIVQPLVKNAVSQRETSAAVLEYFAVNGTTFSEIIHKLWDKFGDRVKGLAVRQDGTWSIETPTLALWRKVMQFKLGEHLVDSTKTEQSWNRWITSKRGETIKLLIYEFGMVIAKTKDVAEFMEACIWPHEIDRSGATEESSLRDVVAHYKAHGEPHFKPAVSCGACGRTPSHEILIDLRGIQLYWIHLRSMWPSCSSQQIHKLKLGKKT